jgi:fatty acid desaturase
MSTASSYVDAKTLKRLSRLSPWRTAAAGIADWLIIAAAITVSELSENWIVYLVAVPVIAGRMHGLAGLLHDFAHYRFIANKQISDAIGDLVLAWPILATIEGYRRNHLAHHRYTNSDMDPDWVIKLGTREFTFPQEMRFAFLNFLGYFVGVSSLRDMRSVLTRIQADDPFTLRYKLARLGYYVAWAVAFTLLGIWREAALYWFVPYFTVFFLLLYVRSVAEHFGETMEYDHELTHTRTVIPHFWERWFFAPHGLNYHLEHHIYASVPFFRLGELHEAMMRNETYAKRAHITRGYTTGLLGEVWLNGWRRKSGSARAAPAK